jgi:hypothetical protein
MVRNLAARPEPSDQPEDGVDSADRRFCAVPCERVLMPPKTTTMQKLRRRRPAGNAELGAQPGVAGPIRPLVMEREHPRLP